MAGSNKINILYLVKQMHRSCVVTDVNMKGWDKLLIVYIRSIKTCMCGPLSQILIECDTSE